MSTGDLVDDIVSDDMVSPVALALALDQFRVGVDHLVKLVEDGGLDALDTAGFVGFMQGFEQIRNRIPLADHRITGSSPTRNGGTCPRR